MAIYFNNTITKLRILNIDKEFANLFVPLPVYNLPRIRVLKICLYY